MKRLEWFIARRYLASRRKGRFLSLITWIAVGGIFVGVMALLTVIAVMTGLQRDLQAKILGTNPHVYIFKSGEGGFRFKGWRPYQQWAEQIPGVVAAAPIMMGQVGVMAHQYTRPAQLNGIDARASRVPMTDVERQIRAGELAFGPTQTGHPGVLLGTRLAQNLGVMTGDVITVGSFDNLKYDPITGYPIPKIMQMEVTGVFSTGMFEYDNAYMYSELATIQDLLGVDSTVVGGIAVNLKDPWQAAQVKEAIDDALQFPYYTDDWMHLNQSLFSALKLEKLAMAVILMLIVLVAAFNIISTLIMVVADKTREIGILKSMGLTDVKVLRIFVLQGLTIGVIGTALGTVGGLILTWILDHYQIISLPGDVYFLDTLPVALDPLDVGLIIVVSVLIAFAATIYPARQAARLLPVEAIRHD